MSRLNIKQLLAQHNTLPRLDIAAISLGASGWLHRFCDATRRQSTVQFACHCWRSVPSWTKRCMQVLSLHKLQISDNEYLRRNSFFPQDPRRPPSACDNRLPFWDPCPCASNTRLSNDVAAFDRQGRIGPFCSATKTTLSDDFSRHLTACYLPLQQSQSEPFRTPFVHKLLWCLHMWPSNQPAITVVAFCRKMLDAHGLDKHMETKFNTFQTRS